MNEDIKQYPIYKLVNGKLIQIYWIKSTDDYDHYLYNLHHYIKKKQYEKNKQWYDDREINQKLILLPVQLHEQVHNQAIKNLSDSEFEKIYKISRWELLFNRKYTLYK